MRTSSTRSCCSGKRVCDAFSENDRLIISSTRSASTRRRLSISQVGNGKCCKGKDCNAL
jgi:hypothetical protein